MSDRTRVNIYRRSADDSQHLSNAGASKRRITGARNQRVNELRLSDLAKLIHGEHGGPCHDHEAARRYFFGALPHILGSRPKLIAFKGDILAAVNAWVIEWTPILRIELGADWIAQEVRKCEAKRHRWPSNDKLARTLQTTQEQVKAHRLCTLVAVERPEAVRDAERAANSAVRSRNHRAKVEGYKPRSETKAAKIRADGGNVNTVKSRERRARLAAEMAATKADPCPVPEDMHPGSNALSGSMHPNSNAALPVRSCTPVRTQHHTIPRTPFTEPKFKGRSSGNELGHNGGSSPHPESLDPPSSELQDTLDAWARYRAIPETVTDLEPSRTAIAYIPLFDPTPEQHAATMAKLRAGADAALSDFGRVMGF